MEKNEQVRTIDMTPTWVETARMLLFVMDNGNEQGKDMARKEIMRMGEILDAYKNGDV